MFRRTPILDGYSEQTVTLELYKQLAEKYDVQVKEVRLVINSFYAYLHKLFNETDVLQPHTCRYIMNINFGVWRPHKSKVDRRIKYLKTHPNGRNDTTTSSDNNTTIVTED